MGRPWLVRPLRVLALRPASDRLRAGRAAGVEWTQGEAGAPAAIVTLESEAAADASLDTDRTKVGLFAALVATRVETEVPRGENAGETLVEHAVVRAFDGPKLFRSSRPLNETRFLLAVPADLARDAADVVVFAQNLGTLEVLAAARVD